MLELNFKISNTMGLPSISYSTIFRKYNSFHFYTEGYKDLVSIDIATGEEKGRLRTNQMCPLIYHNEKIVIGNKKELILSDFDFKNVKVRPLPEYIETDNIGILSNTLISISNRDKGFRAIYDLELNEEIYRWPYQKYITYVSEDYCLLTDISRTVLAYLDISKREITWELSNFKLRRGRNFKLDFKDYIIHWIPPHSLVWFDKKDGKNKFEINGVPANLVFDGINKVYNLNEQSFHSIDIAKRQHSVFNEKKVFEDKAIDIAWKNTWYDGYIYFSSFTGSKLGAFRINDKQLVWKFDLKEEMEKLGYHDILKPPILKKDKLIVQDATGTIWFFSPR